MIHEIIGLISGLVSIVAYLLYIYTIWWGDTRPSRSSWWILTVVWSVVLLSCLSLSSGATIKDHWINVATAWLSVSYILGSLGIAISTIWRGSKMSWVWSDYVCALFAVVAIIFYLFIQDPRISLVLAIIADVFGLMPTIIHAWQDPLEEDLTAWIIESTASVIGIFAVTHWVLSFTGASDWASPIYLAIVNIIVTILIGRRYLYPKAKADA